MIQKIILFFLLSLIFFISSSFATDILEAEKKIDTILSTKKDINEEQKNQIKQQVFSIMAVRSMFDYRDIKDPCKQEIDKFCSKIDDPLKITDCIKKNRNEVSQLCENSLRNTFGGKPFSEAKMYAGVLLPKGSYFFYHPSGKILGAIVSENFKYKGVEYKKGQVRFNEEGISVASLAKDQIINGIKYKENGLGPFFDRNGNVTNATLAEETMILGIYYRSNTQILFNQDGTVQQGTLARDASIDDKIYTAGTLLRFEPDGNIIVLRVP